MQNEGSASLTSYMLFLNDVAALDANHRSSRLVASVALLIANMLFLPAQMALAGPCEDADRYYLLWRQADAEAAATLGGNIFNLGAALSRVPQIAEYKRLYEQAKAECAKLHGGQGTSPNTGPRGYGPPRTGLDWKPFLADLRPKAVASQIRQGDNFADKGDWDAAAKLYDQAARIDPKSHLARQKANDAHQKLDHAAPSPTAQQPTAPPSQPEAGNQPSVPAPPDTSKATQTPQAVQPPSAENAYKQNPSPANAEKIKDLVKAQSNKTQGRLRFPDEEELGK